LIKDKYDIIHIHHPDPMSNLALWLIKPKGKYIVHWHSDILKQKYLMKIYRPLQTWLLKRSDAIICTSKPYADNSNDLKPFLDKISIIPIGIDKSKLLFDQSVVNSIKKRFKNKKIVLAIGRMSYYKGYHFLIEASKYFRPEVILLIIGEGELKNELEKKVIKEELCEKIIFLGKENDIIRNSYLYASDIFVLSSIFKTEAFAIVQLEAMAFGKPIVSTKIPGSGVDWVNQNMISGITIPVQNSLSIAKAVNLMVEDLNLYNQLSNNAMLRFKNNFTQKIMSNKIIKLYQQIL
jgi:rhamnosyl/mannosyltransferase